MRLIYTSPRSENIDRVVALFDERGIESTVTNRPRWKRSDYQRFSYTQKQDNRDNWPQVWITRAEDYASARALLRELGIEPLIRYGEELAAARHRESQPSPRRAPMHARRILLLLVLAIAVLQTLHYYFRLI